MHSPSMRTLMTQSQQNLICKQKVHTHKQKNILILHMLATMTPVMLQWLCSLPDDPMQYQLSTCSLHPLPSKHTQQQSVSSLSPQHIIRAPCLKKLPPACMCRKHGRLSCSHPKYGNTRQTTYMKSMVVQVTHIR